MWSLRFEAKFSAGARSSGFVFTPRIMEPRWSKDCSAREGRRRSAARASSASRAVMRLAWRPPPMFSSEAGESTLERSAILGGKKGTFPLRYLLAKIDR